MKQNKNKKEGEGHTWPHPCSPPEPAQPATATPPLVVFLLPVGAAACSHARGRGGHLLPAWLPPPSLVPPATPRSPDPLSLLPRSLDLPPPRSSVSPPATEWSRRHRREPPWLPATPRLTDAPGSSAGPPSTSSTSHEAPDVPQHRPRCLLQPRDRLPSSLNSPAPDHPRPRLRLEWIRCEPPLPLLCSPPPFSPPSPISHRGRELLAAGHGVAVATATAARSRAHHRDQHDRMKP